MNNKTNYTLVGILVLFGFILVSGFSYWLLKPTVKDETRKYSIYFSESVLGLNIDAPVKYRGISVGKVTSLEINPKNSEEVEVIITILNSTPIKSSTVAQLTSQGITGLSYINLNLGDNNAPNLEVKDGQKYPVIQTAPSFFNRFETQLGSVSNSLTQTLNKTEELLNAENQKQISLVLQRTANIMEKMDRLLDDETIKNLQQSSKNLNSASNKLDTMMPNINKFVNNSVDWENKVSGSMQSIMTSYLGVRESMNAIFKAVSSGEFNLKEITKDVVPTLNNTLIEMQQLMIRTEGVLTQYERSPGDILFKQEQVKKGPGE